MNSQLLAKIVSRHHAVIIHIDDASPPTNSTVKKSSGANLAELGACFVTTLLHHSDHIFRHDPEVRSSFTHSLDHCDAKATFSC